MSKREIATDQAPKALGPYSQAIVANGMVFCSGQIPLDPVSGAIPEGIEAQTRQVLANLTAVLAKAGSGMDKVVKSTVFLKDMNDFAAMNAVYAEAFAAPPPARSTIEVARLPRDVRIEIEVIAIA